ncbi:MAG: tyrosine decarboxylase MfnA [Candidatus Bathyarchaeota archaeon]|nr:tyrosine decarboxylase MfnA [Candidatus Bathyarchaeota archaeon]
MQENGQSKSKVLAELRKRGKADTRYDEGRILCSMCTKPHSVAKKAYRLFFDSNLGDSGLFPAAAQLEREVIADLASLLHCSGAGGFVVSGGTEANLLALQAAKTVAGLSEPEVVLPQSAHFSFTKICKLTNLKPIYAPLDDAFRADASAVEELINKNTVAIVGTAGSAEMGAVDPIDALSEVALAHGVHLHVDAAFGGLVIPFLKAKRALFDFQLKGVASVTVDPHKMGLAAIPAGGILFRNPEMLETLKVHTPYLSDAAQYTFVGTRSGASAASAWAVFRFLGQEGYRKIVAGCIKNTALLATGIHMLGLSLVCEPDLNVVAFRSGATKQLAQRLWKQGWFISYIPRYDCIRVVVMPHVKARHIRAFLEALKKENLQTPSREV